MHLKNNYSWCKTFVDGSVNFSTLKTYMDENAHTVVCGTSTMYKGVGFDNDRIEKTIDNIKKIKSIIK